MSEHGHTCHLCLLEGKTVRAPSCPAAPAPPSFSSDPAPFPLPPKDDHEQRCLSHQLAVGCLESTFWAQLRPQLRAFADHAEGATAAPLVRNESSPNASAATSQCRPLSRRAFVIHCSSRHIGIKSRDRLRNRTSRRDSSEGRKKRSRYYSQEDQLDLPITCRSAKVGCEHSCPARTY